MNYSYLRTKTKAETATIILQISVNDIKSSQFGEKWAETVIKRMLKIAKDSVDLKVKIIFGELYMPPEKTEKIDIIKKVNRVFGENNSERGLNKCCAWKMGTKDDCKSAQALEEGKIRIPKSYYKDDGYHINDERLLKMVRYLRNYFDNQHKTPSQPSEEKKAEIIKRKRNTAALQKSNVEKKKQKKTDEEEDGNQKPGCSHWK